MVNDPPRYSGPVGFLGALQASMRQAAEAVAAGAARSDARHRYVHGNELYLLARHGRGVDAKRSRGYREEGLLAAGDVAHRLDYRVLDAGGREVDSFQLWTVFPADADAAGASDAPVLPLAFEFRPRKYLELKARRNPPPAQGTSASTMMEHGQR